MRTKSSLVLCVLLAAALGARADDPKPDKAKTDPPGVSILATLTSDAACYDLPDGADGYRKRIEAGDYPAAPAVNLSLELKNTSNNKIDIRMGGTTNVIDLDLRGPDALSVELKGRITPKFIIAPKTITLDPGKSQTVPITSLSFGFKGSHNAYWLAAGKYTLTATYHTTVSPAPAAAQPADDGFGTVTITSAPLTVVVK